MPHTTHTNNNYLIYSQLANRQNMFRSHLQSLRTGQFIFALILFVFFFSFDRIVEIQTDWILIHCIGWHMRPFLVIWIHTPRYIVASLHSISVTTKSVKVERNFIVRSRRYCLLLRIWVNGHRNIHIQWPLITIKRNFDEKCERHTRCRIVRTHRKTRSNHEIDWFQRVVDFVWNLTTDAMYVRCIVQSIYMENM